MPIDVVCGAKVKRDTPYKYEHGGKTYYFCSEECMEKFKSSPTKYIVKVRSGGC